MARPKTALQSPALVFPRATPEQMQAAAGLIKTCTMNCGRHLQDTRSDAELKALCEDCDTRPKEPKT